MIKKRTGVIIKKVEITRKVYFRKIYTCFTFLSYIDKNALCVRKHRAGKPDCRHGTGYAEQNFVIVKHVGIFYIAEMFIYGGRDKRRAHRNGREKYRPELIEESFDAVG